MIKTDRMAYIMKNNEIIDRLLTLGKIPKDSEMTDEQFKKYYCLLAMFEEDLSFEEAEQMMPRNLLQNKPMKE